MAANAEEFLLKLNQQISGPASVAAGALAQLEGQIRSEQSALAGLQAKAATAGAAVGAQSAYVKDLQAQLGGAGLSGKQFDALGAKVAAATAKLHALQKAEASAKGGAADKGANVGKLQTHLPNLKVKADFANAEGAAKKLKDAASGAEETGASFRQLGAAAGETDGPLGNMVRTIGKFKAAGAAGAALAIVGVIIAIATAAIAGAIALTRFALAMADAARSSALMSGAAAGSAKGGEELERVINDVANKSPLARDKIAEMARAMEVAHLQGRNMQNALEAATTAASAIGDGAASAFTSIAESSQKARRFLLSKQDLEGTGVAFAEVAASLAKGMGISVAAATTLIQRGGVSVAKGLEAMNAAVQAKFGKTVAAQMISLTTQMAKLKENFGRLFDGINIEPFLEGLKTITDLFSDQTVTGAALKTLFNSIFTPLAEASGGIFPIISAFLRGMVIATLSAYLGFMKVRAAIREAFGGDSAGSIDWIKTAMVAGQIAVISIGAALIALVVIIGLVAVSAIIMAAILLAPFLLAAAGVYLLIAAFDWVTTTLNDAVIGAFRAAGAAISGFFSSAWESVKSAALAIGNAVLSIADIDLSAAGMNIVNGLVNGIKSGISAVVGAVTSLGSAAKSAFTGNLLIRSPSQVFHAYGEYTAQGFGEGVESGIPDANDSIKKLGSGEPSTPEKGSAPGGGRVFNFAAGAVVFNGAREDFAAFELMFAEMVERLADEGPEARA